MGFVQTTYTAVEGVGSVEMCVELTSPLRDIIDETVTVSVVDYSASTYIPAGSTLASMELCCVGCKVQFCIFSSQLRSKLYYLPLQLQILLIF